MAVVPCFACISAIFRKASVVPSIKSWPPPPCICISIKPGEIYFPFALISSASGKSISPSSTAVIDSIGNQYSSVGYDLSRENDLSVKNFYSLVHWKKLSGPSPDLMSISQHRTQDRYNREREPNKHDAHQNYLPGNHRSMAGWHYRKDP
jgi:hypothetical protein